MVIMFRTLAALVMMVVPQQVVPEKVLPKETAMVATKMMVAVIAIMVVQTVVVAIVLLYFRRVATLSLLGDLVVSNSPGPAKGQHHNLVLLSIDLQQ